MLEGHPVDVERLQARPSASALFTGTTAMFQAAGFTEVRRTYPSCDADAPRRSLRLAVSTCWGQPLPCSLSFAAGRFRLAHGVRWDSPLRAPGCRRHWAER